MTNNIKKIIAGVVVIGVFAAYIIFQKFSSNKTVVATNNNSTSTETLPSETPSTTPSTAAFKDGTYTGSVANAYFGPLQVKAVIKNGTLADVVFVQYPNDRTTSVRINTDAMPQLKSEAIATQSAKVNTISGATQTTQAFNESLQVALNQAKA